MHNQEMHLSLLWERIKILYRHGIKKQKIASKTSIVVSVAEIEKLYPNSSFALGKTTGWKT